MNNESDILKYHIKQLKAKEIIRYDADIVRDTGVNKGVLSTYISGKEMPSKKFIKNFEEKYKLSFYADYEARQSGLTFQKGLDNYTEKGYNPAMPGFNESQKATAITTDLGLSSAALMMICEVVAKLTGEPVGAV